MKRLQHSERIQCVRQTPGSYAHQRISVVCQRRSSSKELKCNSVKGLERYPRSPWDFPQASLGLSCQGKPAEAVVLTGGHIIVPKLATTH